MDVLPANAAACEREAARREVRRLKPPRKCVSAASAVFGLKAHAPPAAPASKPG